MFCPRCQREFAEGSVTCPCGEPAPAAPVVPAAATDQPQLPVLHGHLVVLDHAGGLLALACGLLLMGLRAAGPFIAPSGTVGILLCLLGVLLLAAGRELSRRTRRGRRLQLAVSLLGLGLFFPLGTLVCLLSIVYLLQSAAATLYAHGREAQPDQDVAAAILRLRSGFGGWTAPLVIILVLLQAPVLGLIAVGGIAKLSGSIDRTKQKRTMSEMRSIGTAIEGYQVDNGFVPDLPSSDGLAELRSLLVPLYIRDLAGVDEWRHPIAWRHQDEGYSLVSHGRDGRPDAEAAAGTTGSLDADIYFSDGQFTRYPEGPQR